MGAISYWQSSAVAPSVGPIPIDRALQLADVKVWHEPGQWMLLLQGFPREWHATRDSAEAAARRWDHMEPSVAYAPDGGWLVFTSDQYAFSSESRQEAEGLVFGLLCGPGLGANRPREWSKGPGRLSVTVSPRGCHGFPKGGWTGEVTVFP